MKIQFQSTVVQSREKTRHGIHDSILECIGGTPIVKVSPAMSPNHNGADVYVKLESENPGGSVKDRLAVGIIEWAEQHGQLHPGQTVVEASSGNTGIGLAMVCAAKGYPLVVVMSEAFSVERRKLMRFYGAQVILTSKANKATGMLTKAKQLADEHGFFYCNQFEAEANAWMHEHTTGREIAEAFDESQIKLDHVVMPAGTGGTVAGVSKKIRSWSPDTTIHVCEPSNAPMLHSAIKTEYPEDGPIVSHPAYNPHLMQGWGVDFIPKILANARASHAFDNILHVHGSQAIATSRDLAKNEGILTGISGGGTLSAALQLAQSLPAGTSVLAVLADTGERYLSTALFEGIPTEMTPEEAYLDATTSAEHLPPVPLPEPTYEAVSFVEETNKREDVVMWCVQHTEGTKVLKDFLERLKVNCEIMYLDSLKYSKDNQGIHCKAALKEIVGSSSLPQLFVGNKLLGGVKETFASWANGSLPSKLDNLGVSYASDLAVTPWKCLPYWAAEEFLNAKGGSQNTKGGSQRKLRRRSSKAGPRKSSSGRTKKRLNGLRKQLPSQRQLKTCS